MATRRFHPFVVLALAVAWVGSASRAAAAAPAPAPAPTPEAVAQKAVTAMKADRMNEYIALMHPDALKRFRTMMLEIVDASVREKKQREVLPLFPGIKTVAQLKKLDANQFFLSFYRGAVAKQPGLKETLKQMQFKSIGHVMEGADLAHVAVQSSLPGGPSSPSVITLRKVGTGWRMLLSGDMEGIAQVIKLRVAGQVPDPASAQTRVQAIGHVPEGTVSAYVVYRAATALGGATMTKMSALIVKKNEPDWEALTSGDRGRTTEALQQRFGLNR